MFTKTLYFVDALYLLPHFESGSLQTVWEDAGEQIRLAARWNWGYMVRHLHLFLWPADMPWLEVPLDLVVSEGISDYAEWRVPKAKLPGSVEYGGCYLALLAVIDPWSGTEVQRPDPRQEDRIVRTPKAKAFYATLQVAVENGTASPEEALMLLSYQYRTGQRDEMLETNRQLWQYAQQSRLDMEQSVLWADLAESLNDPQAYKLACWCLYGEQAVSNLIDNTSNANLRSRYLSHLPDNLPRALSTAYSCLLEAGFPEVHRQCIASLCRMKEELGIGELLKDVEAGKILAAEAVEVLRPVYDFASDYLWQKKTVDALEVLRQLTLAEGKSPKWIEPGFRLYTDIGISRVLSIRDIGSDRTMERCWSGNACKLEVETQAPRLHATITTMNLQEYEIQFPWDHVYQCALCEIISGNSLDSINSHLNEQHPYDESPSFRERKPPFKLAHVEIHLPESGA